MGAVHMAVGWALVSKENPTKFANLLNLTKLAADAGQPWAKEVTFKITAPLTKFWTEPGKPERHWDALVEIDGVGRGQLEQIFKFIHDNCSHVDGIG